MVINYYNKSFAEGDKQAGPNTYATGEKKKNETHLHKDKSSKPVIQLHKVLLYS